MENSKKSIIFVVRKESDMTLLEFLKKETPAEGGCMVCLAKYPSRAFDRNKKEFVSVVKEEYMLVERHTISNGEMFTINKRFHYDYDFTWDEQTPWEILYKKEA